MELVASYLRGCPNKNVRHETDDLKELHGTLDKPIVVEEIRDKKYVQWEYAFINRAMPGPYHICLQSLHKDGQRQFDRVVVRDYSGNHHVFLFDITAAMAERDKEMKKAFGDLQAGRPVSPDLEKFIKKAIELKRTGQRRVDLSDLDHK